MVECGGLENRLAPRGHEGSNPSSSAIEYVRAPSKGLFSYQADLQGIRTERSSRSTLVTEPLLPLAPVYGHHLKRVSFTYV